MECSNCTNFFHENNLPKLLVNCGHTICFTCLQKLYSSQKIICPECKEENQIIDLNQVPTNQALLTLNLNSKDAIAYESVFPTFKRFSSVNESPSLSKRNNRKCTAHQKTIEAFCIYDCEGLCIDCILSENYKNKEILSIEKAAIILQEQIKNDYKFSLEKEKKIRRNLENLEKLERNMGFWKKRNEDEIKTFFEEYKRVLREKELKCLESNENHYNQNIIHLKSSKNNNDNNLCSMSQYNKILNVLVSTNKNENINEFLSNMKLVYQMKAKMAHNGEIACEDPHYENYAFDKETEIKLILNKLKESYGGSLNATISLKEKLMNENVNNTICYFSNDSEEKRLLHNVSMISVAKTNNEKENYAPLVILPSKSNSPFSLEKKTIKTTKSVNFRNFSTNIAFDQRHSPNIKINRSKSPVLNQRKHSKPDNISYNMMRKLKTDLEEADPSNTSVGTKNKKIVNPKEVSNSLNNFNKDLANKNNSKSIGSLFITKKINLENEKKNYKLFILGGFSIDKQFSIEEYDSKSKEWSIKYNSTKNKAKFGSIVYNNSIILFGGKSDGKRLNSFFKYECFSSKMVEMNLKLSIAKSGFGFCIKDDEILVCGGNDGVAILDTFESYNLKTMTIKKLPSMNHKRDEMALVLDSHDNIYAIGGYCNQNNCLNSVEKFDFKLNKWIMLANLIEPRRSLNAVSLGQNMYAIGGFNGFQYLNTVEKYDEANDKWVSVKPMKESRCTFSAIGLNEENAFLVMGGFNNTPLNTCEIYNEKKDAWEEFKGLEMKRFMHSCNMIYLDN